MSENTAEQTNTAAEAAPTPDAKPKKVKQTPEEKAAIAAEKQRVKDEAKAAKDAAKAVPKAKDTKNGITRPSTGVTLLVWTTADALSAELKQPVERAPLVEKLKGKVEVGTIHTQYGRWRKYYGLVETKEERQARLAKAKEAKAAANAELKAKKKAEKEKADAAKAEQKAAEKAKKDAAKAAKDAEAATKQPELAPTE